MNAPAPALHIAVEKRLSERITIAADFQAGDGVTALFGRSGAGKTSLVEMIAGLLRPDRGRIAVQGRVLFDSQARIDLPAEARRVGYVFQDARLFPHLTVRRNLLYGRWAGRRRGALKLETVCRLLDLDPLLERRPGALSGGEVQRVAIGRALLADPAILLMDEPLASLDGPRKNEILPFLERLKEESGVPIVYVSHAMEEVIRLADQMVLLDGGRVAAVGPIEDVTTRLDLRPLTGRYEAGAVVPVRVEGHDEAYELTTLLITPEAKLQVPRLKLPVGAALRIRLRARDVTLSLTRPEGASTLNVLAGAVRELAPAEGPFVDVLVDAGAPIWSRVTRLSADRMGLAPGRAVYAVVKAGAIDRASLGRAG
ncbi:MAG: molybdenum ABC transporter ATP-binding protein [Marivibrio sp.]|uniref:molybdenum ABC transporter ATP-binding protein n=1 Tax=Marivibrio sp. TaxID=2039719 RepID=UPI0032F006D3